MDGFLFKIGGDARLGGDDWDAAIMQWIIDKHLKPAQVNWKQQAVIANLKTLAEYARVQLSSSERVVLRWRTHVMCSYISMLSYSDDLILTILCFLQAAISGWDQGSSYSKTI